MRSYCISRTVSCRSRPACSVFLRRKRWFVVHSGRTRTWSTALLQSGARRRSVSSCVLDASAALAVLKSEPGASMVVSMQPSSLMSAVNLAEVQGRMMQLGMQSEQAWQAALKVAGDVVSFDDRQARTTAELLSRTRALGLSLGDRACLALAMERKLPVLTADKAWKALRVGVEIRVIR